MSVISYNIIYLDFALAYTLNRIEAIVHYCVTSLLYRVRERKVAFTCFRLVNFEKILNYQEILKDKLIYVKHKYFIVYEATCFELFKRSSSGLLADRVNRCCVHVGIPICLH